MTGVDFSLLIGALICALVSWRNRRGLLWIGAGALSYIVSTIAWRFNLSMAEVVTGFADVTLCLAVYLFAKYRWELAIWRLYQVSVGISILYLAGNLGITSRWDHEMYAILLEAVNWLLLIFIGGMGVAQRIGTSDVRAGGLGGRIRDFARSLQRERKIPAFTRVPR